jgi:radical SAM superfamily enzyme YgiQ (UPF0313 family)
LPELKISFYQAYFDSDETILSGCIDADYVAFSCTSPSFAHGLSLATRIKAQNKLTRCIFGGWHISALKEKVLSREIDQIVVGEGEEALLKIIMGDTSKIVFGKKLTFDSLSWPDRSLIKNYRTIDLCEKAINKRVASFQSNRVCPFSCAYCSERIVTGKFGKDNQVRTRRVEDTCSEIEQVIDTLNINYFKFVDATFDVSPEYVINFCKEKIKRNINTEWECMIHASLANEEMFGWLKEAKCNQVDIGCESGSPKILRDIGKGTTPEIISNVFSWAKKNTIKRRAFFILGMPNEKPEDVEQTRQMALKIQPDVIGFTILCPYPGSDLYSEKFESVDWSSTDEYSNSFWKNPYFSNIELKETQSRLTKEFKSLLCERQK